MAQTIVVGTDGSDPAERAVREAIRIAARDGAQLHVVTAFHDQAMYRERIASGATTVNINLQDVGDNVAARAVREAEAAGVKVTSHVHEGDPAEAILDTASEQNADLIVVGDRGLSGVQRFLLGSVSQKVSEHAACNVMIVRTDQAEPSRSAG
jgi:nucleotide-binding universal stress UspA family protein